VYSILYDRGLPRVVRRHVRPRFRPLLAQYLQEQGSQQQMRETCAHVTTESNPGRDTPAGLALVSLQTLDVRRSLQQVVSLCVDFARMTDAGLGSVLRLGGRPQPLSWPYVRPVAV